VRRGHVLALIAVGVILFLVVSAVLARAFSVDSAERSAITAVVQAEARGDAAGVAARINGCARSSACRARVAADTRALEHPGAVSIIQIQSSAGFSLGGSVGTARVAWTVASGLPIVQCVRVHRAGNVITGLHVELLGLSRRITPSDTPCPARF
jgi:hypothetical protein